MEYVQQVVEWILHLDHYLGEIIQWLGGGWFYGLIFGVVFCETGLVVTPFLPGDSLLFAVGALAGTQSEHISIVTLVPLLIVAAILGDAVNYSIGNYLGPKVFRNDTGLLLNKSHLLRAQAFYQRHGGKAIFLARFLPILRTFAPFVAGIGKMEYRRFCFYNAMGGVVWVTLFLVAGYLFGNVEVVKKNFSLVLLVIILLSVVPIVYEWWRERKFRTPAS